MGRGLRACAVCGKNGMKRDIFFIFLISAAALTLAGCHARRVPGTVMPGSGTGFTLPRTAAQFPPAASTSPVVSAAPVPDPRAAAAQAIASSLLRQGRAAAAAREFHRCLVLEPGRGACLDGKGRAHAALREWEDAALAWAELAELHPEDRKLAARLKAARRSWKAFLDRRAQAARHTGLGEVSQPPGAPVNLLLTARFQRYRPGAATPADIYDTDINSPKSVSISSDGAKAYVNSLEGGRTVIYDALSLAKLGHIDHVFGPRQAQIFPGTVPWFGSSFSPDLPPGGPNVFSGKPVESEFSHAGRFLWVPYYRRSFDLDGTQPSAVAVIDTAAEAIVRVLPTGPIAKNAAASPDGRYMALAHWGDNSVGFIGISSTDPAGFYPAALVAIGPRDRPAGSEGVNRDSECGLCVRGLAWSRDSRALLAGCMGGSGGVAVIDTASPDGPRLLARVQLGGKPRDLVVSPDGKWLYVSASNTGSIIRAETAQVIEAAASTGPAVHLATSAAITGGAPRSLRLSPDGKWLFTALNADSQIAVIDAENMELAARMAADSFPVGLDLSPDGSRLWVTSQGIDGAGGNSVEIYAVTYSSAGPPAALHTARKPPPL